MMSASIKAAKWTVPAVALCVGLAVGHKVDFQLGSAAQAEPSLPSIERLLIKDEIREKIALYGLYADGDGKDGKPRDLRTLADTLMTPDVVSEIHPANGMAPFTIVGRDKIANSPPENHPERARRVVGRHYLISTTFDDISPTTVHTRTAAAYFDVTRNLVGPDCAKQSDEACGGVPVKTVLWVYHMTWTKTPQGWMISKNILRDDN